MSERRVIFVGGLRRLAWLLRVSVARSLALALSFLPRSKSTRSRSLARSEIWEALDQSPFSSPSPLDSKPASSHEVEALCSTRAATSKGSQAGKQAQRPRNSQSTTTTRAARPSSLPPSSPSSSSQNDGHCQDFGTFSKGRPRPRDAAQEEALGPEVEGGATQGCGRGQEGERPGRV